MALPRKLSIRILLFISFSYFIFIAAPLPSAPIPSDDKVLIQTGLSSKVEIPESFNLLIWNIQKASEGSIWQKDFNKISEKSDLVLLQEGYLIDAYKRTIENIPNFLWTFAISFIYNGFETGIVTGSNVTPVSTSWIRSIAKEPIYNSPKMTLLTQYLLSHSVHPLLVANIHGINFVSNNSFYKQMDQVFSALEKHKGPIIFAGDFNTWNYFRIDYLKINCQKINLKQIVFNEDPRFFQLDHVFYKDLIPTSTQVLSQITSSDHYPLNVTFKINQRENFTY